MADTSKKKVRTRDLFYYRKRFKNRVFGALVSFFVKEAEESGITKKDIAERLDRDPALITRWLSNPGNLTLDTISDLLLAMDAEADPPMIVRFKDRVTPNYAHPLIRGVAAQVRQAPPPLITLSNASGTAKAAPVKTQVKAELEELVN